MHLLALHLSPSMREHGNERQELVHALFLCVTINLQILQLSKKKKRGKEPSFYSLSLIPHSNKMFNRKTKPVSYLLDMTHLSNYWGCDGKPARM